MLVFEAGGPAVHSGLIAHPLPGDRGRITPDQLREVVRISDDLQPPSIVVLEQTHRSAGGRVWPLDELAAVAETARELGSPSTSTAPGFSTRPSRAASRLPNTARSATPSRCASRRASAARSGRSSRARGRRWARPGAGSSCSAARCGRRGWSPRRRSSPSTITSTGSPTITHARGGSPRACAEAGLPVDPATVETNFVGLEVEPLGLTTEEATERIASEGVLVGWLRPGVLRLATYLGVEDDDIDAAVRRDSARSRRPRRLTATQTLRSPTSRNASATSP